MTCKQYLKSTVYRAARFAVGMADADVEALCMEFNAGRDATMHNVFYNGAAMMIIRPGSAALTVSPGNWIVRMPDESLDVRADGDFCTNFCPAAS
jgi:hypothetical protein